MRILSGIQPTGAKHLGNYIGAIRHYVTNQQLGDAFYFLADLHALTTGPDPAELRAATLDTATMLLAAGVDPERATLFAQSHVAAQHTELTWMLACGATFGELRRMTQFKDKSDGKGDSVNIGIFTYPVLMAADVLLYDADRVPVGADQKQHLELARNLAQRFNNRYGAGTFVVPEPLTAEVGARVRDLQDPTAKMSTSKGSDKGRVYVLDPPEKVAKKIRSAVTDSDDPAQVRFDWQHKPGVSNLLELLAISTDRSVDDVAAEFAGAGYGALKVATADAVVEYLRPVRERYDELQQNADYVHEVLARGAERARELASAKVTQVRALVGLLAEHSQVSTGA